MAGRVLLRHPVAIAAAGN